MSIDVTKPVEILIEEAKSATTSPETQMEFTKFDDSRHVVIGTAPVSLQQLHVIGAILFERYEELKTLGADNSEIQIVANKFRTVYNLRWNIAKDRFPELNKHNKIVVLENWQIGYCK